MRAVSRWLIGCALGALILAASTTILTAPASADPFWQTVTKTSKFHCTTVPWNPPGLSTETCIVVNGNATQSVAIVHNYSGLALTIEAPHVELWHGSSIHYDRNCLSSTLNSGFSRACFAPTVRFNCGDSVSAWSEIVINGTHDGRWSPTRQMCS